MKKIASVFILAGMTLATNAMAAPSYIQRDGRWGYNVTYDYTDKAKTGWYVAGRGELSFLNFENKYHTALADDLGVSEDDSDKYSMEPLFGGSVSFGKKINYFWRVDGEAGFIGSFSDKDNGTEFQMNVPYLTANVYYDFTNGLYLGAGAGAAIVTTKIDGDAFLPGDRNSTSVSPMGALMLGWSHKLDDNFVIDLRYRFAGFTGHKHERRFELLDEDDNDVYTIETKTGFVMDNSISVGLRYEF
ncbi:porin family protein [bacterium]|nr:porin family protein [bacterium]